MSPIQILSVLVTLLLCCSAVLGLLLLRTQRHNKELESFAVDRKRESEQTAEQLALVRKESQELRQSVERRASEQRRSESELAELRLRVEEAQRNPTQSIVRRAYNIVTIGISSSGKTALTLKWANPLFRLQDATPTQFLKYERTVSRQVTKGGPTVEHVFEIRDWGGEHMESAFMELVTMKSVNGLLIVVDLGRIIEDPKHKGRSTVVLDEERIKAQIETFHPAALRFFFTDHILSYCKTFVLFINKSDALSGLPDEIERKAMELYKPLIDSLRKFQRGDGLVDIQVIVGSAHSGHNTQNLFAHFIEKILPQDAYDHQLLTMMQAEPPTPASSGAPLSTRGRSGNGFRTQVES